MIRVAPRFLITFLSLSALGAFGAAAHGPIAPKPQPAIAAPALIEAIGRRIGLEKDCDAFMGSAQGDLEEKQAALRSDGGCPAEAASP